MDKQVVGGYHRPVCVNCKHEMVPLKNDVGLLDRTRGEPYKLFSADLWGCPTCGIEVIGGFGAAPIACNWEADLPAWIEKYLRDDKLYENYYD